MGQHINDSRAKSSGQAEGGFTSFKRGSLQALKVTAAIVASLLMVAQSLPVAAIAEIVNETQQGAEQAEGQVDVTTEGEQGSPETDGGDGSGSVDGSAGVAETGTDADAVVAANFAEVSGTADANAGASASNSADAAASTDVVDASNFAADDTDLIAAEELDEASYAALLSESSQRAVKSVVEAKVEPETNNQEPISGDDQRIEKIIASWVTPDDVEDNDPSRLTLKPEANSTDVFTAKMRLIFSLSGQYEYKPGEIQLVIPKNIFKNRDGNEAGHVEISVPEAPDETATFSYRELDDSYVVVNNKTLSAATSAMFEFATFDLKPLELIGNGELKDGEKSPAAGTEQTEKDKYVTDHFYGTVNLTTHSGNVLSMTSNKLDASVDTNEEIGIARLRCESLSESYPSDWPAELKPENADEYVYIDWYSYVTTKGNQPYTLTINTDSSACGYDSALLGVTFDGVAYKNGEGGSTQTVRLTDENAYDTTRTGDYTGYVHTYVAYPKSQFPDGGHYTIKHKITYSLTSADDHKVTTAPAEAQKAYSPISFKDPQGHFNVFKYYDGKYPYALDMLRDGESVTCSYRVQSVAFTGPWTTGKDADYGDFLEGDYGQVPVTVDTHDFKTQFDHQTADLTSVDFEFQGVYVAQPQVYEYKKYEQGGYGYRENSEGVVEWGHINGGSYGYARTTDASAIPDAVVYGSVSSGSEDGENWIELGTISYSSGKLAIAPNTENGAGVSGNLLVFPSNVTDFKTSVTTKAAGVIYTMYPKVTVKSTDAVRARVEDLFKNSDTPSTILRNWAQLHAYDSGGNTIVTTARKAADDTLAGTATGITMEKSATVEDDKANRKSNIHYTASVYEQTNLTTLELYNAAKEAGSFEEDASGTFYDLLPKGVEPDTSTVKLNGDNAVESVTLTRNYKGSGRTLMTVKASVVPDPRYRDKHDCAGQSYDGYGNKITIEFDATYSYDSQVDYGVKITNNIAYESGCESWGTIEGLKGEPDNPTAGNNNTSANAVQGVEGIMTDLDPANDNPSFVYAKCATTIDNVSWAVSSLNKQVDVNYEGDWGSGLDVDGAKNVYENGAYSYRISMTNSDETTSKDMVFFDAVGAFDPASDSIIGDKPDAGDTQWRGRLLGVDTSALELADIAPVVYYSTTPVDELGLDYSAGAKVDVSDTRYWTPAASYAGSLDDVTAVAVDASKKIGGSDFELKTGGTISFTLQMRAPQVKDLESDPAKYSQWFDADLADGESEAGLAGGAHEYNNATLRFTTVSEVGAESKDQYIRKDYVKVGLKPFGITVTKAWDDADNRDGMRTDSVTVHVYANGVDTGKSAVLSKENGWTAEFGSDDGLTVLDTDGNQISYTLVEDAVNGYSPNVVLKQGDSGYVFELTNKHKAETVTVEGTKAWDDGNDAAGKRPSSIQVSLYADGVLSRTKTVKADDSGNWTYSFSGLPKYRDQGQEISYEVREDMYYEGYVSTLDGTDIVNTYSPYGDLSIEKKIVNATDASSKADFTFTLSLAGADGEPDGGSYEYETSDGRTGTIANGGSLTLKGGQTATVKNIPSETTYKVTEAAASGYTQTTVEGDGGVIRAGSANVAKAVFTNAYSASGQARLSVRKELTGRAVERGLFLFTVHRDSADGSMVAAARNDADGNVQFGTIRYGLSDIGAHRYVIVEKNEGKSGYTYSDQVFIANVMVSDNGDGTLATEVGYAKVGEDGSETPVSAAEVVFNNKYEASGKLGFTAWKTLEGRDLKADEFNFKLERLATADAESGEQVGELATNDADGTVTFVSVEYNQDDAGKTYYYRVSEVAGSDDAVEYDESSFVYTVTVKDNGDGTLSFDQAVNEKPVFKNTLKDGSLRITKKVQGEAGDPNHEFTFHVQLTGTNLPADGTYEFEREAAPADEDAVEGEGAEVNGGAEGGEESADEGLAVNSLSDALGLTVGDAEDEGGIDALGLGADESGIALASVEDGESAIALAANSEADPNIAAWYGDVENGLYKDKEITLPDASVHGAVTSSGTVGTADYNIYSDGTLRVHAGAFAWNDLTQKVILANNDSVSYVEFEQGCRVTGVTRYPGENTLKLKSMVGSLDTSELTKMEYMFYKCSFMTTLALSGVDSSKVTTMRSVFGSCASLASLDVTQLDTAKVENMSNMFSSCRDLTSIDLSRFDTARVENMASMFYKCDTLTALDLSSFNTSNVTNMSQMFGWCSMLTSLNLSGLNTALVTNMASMFHRCEKLTALDLSSFNTSSVTDMSYMFNGCASLTTLDVSGFGTSNVADMSSMFLNCKKLESLDVSGFETGKVAYMSYMFDGCSGLSGLDLSGFDTSNVKGMSGMFALCGSITSLDLSGFDTSSTTDMSAMFSGCSGLTSLDLSNFDTSKVTNMQSMFYNCIKLTSLNVSKFETSKVANMALMFYNCRITELDLSSFTVSGTTNTVNMFTYLPLTVITLGEGWGANSEKTGFGHATPSGSSYKDSWVRDGDGMSYTSKGLMTNGGMTNISGTWRRASYTYTVAFDKGNGAASGSMTDATYDQGTSYTLPSCAYYSLKHAFAGWKISGANLVKGVDTTKVYQAGEVFASGLAEEDSTATLTAQWAEVDNHITIKDGGFDIALRANESGVIKSLPAGTGYNVYEKTADGWVLVESSGTSGVIEATTESAATFTNAKGEGGGKAQAILMAMKTIDGAPAAAGAYTFVLKDASTDAELQRVENGAGGVVTFRLDELTKGTANYTITEVACSDTDTNYDTSVVNATVKVEEKNGSLVADVTYDGAAATPVFKNTTNKHYGSLEFTKKVEDAPASESSREFSFRIDWTDARASETFTLAAGRTKRWDNLTPGVGYTITELNIPDGYSADSAIVSGTVGRDAVASASITNTYGGSAKGSFTANATKKLDGRALEEGEFTFELLPVNEDGTTGAAVASAMNDAKGNVEFGAVEVTGAGEYRYRIREAKGNDDSVSYDEATHDLTVKAEVDSADPTKLDCTVTYDDGGLFNFAPTFTNTYTAPKGSFTVEAKKALEGRELKAEEFTFELVALNDDGSEGKVVGTAKNDAGDNVKFGAVELACAGTYQYRIREKAGNEAGVVYDDTTYDVTVRATAAANNTLTCAVIYPGGEAPTFTNKYAATGFFTASAKKVLNGRDLAEGEFGFKLVEIAEDGSDGDTVATATNDAQGNVSFKDVAVSAAGEYRYRIREVSGDADGVSYDTNGRGLTVKATDAGAGKLACEVTYDEGEVPTFTNTYRAPGTFVVEAKKVLDGRDLKRGEFTFELVEANADGSAGKVVDTATNEADGSIAFPAQIVGAAGEYRYLVREAAGDDEYVDYDSAFYYVTVVADGNADGGNLSCSVRYGTDDGRAPTFTNTVNPHYGSLSVTKLVSGTEQSADKFRFRIEWGGGQAEDFELAAGETKTWDNLTPGTTYKVAEVDVPAGYTPDQSEYTGTIDKDAAVKVNVTNTYTAPVGSFAVSAKKVLEGRELKAGEFTFELVLLDGDDADGTDGTVIASAKNDADGNVAFPSVAVSEEGESRYLVREVAGSDEDVTYDPVSHGLTAKAVANGNKLDVTVFDEDGNAVEDGGSVATFTNTVDQRLGSLSVTKVVSGTERPADKFKFRIEWGGSQAEDFELAAGETKTWDGLVPGTTYKVAEVDVPAGYTPDQSEYTGTIGKDAVVKVTVTNTYKAPGSFSVVAKKLFPNHELKGGEFTFELVCLGVSDPNGIVVGRATNDAAGTVAFPSIAVSEEGESRFLVREVVGDDEEMLYDRSAHEFTAKAAWNGDELEVTILGEGGKTIAAGDPVATFTNRLRSEVENENDKKKHPENPSNPSTPSNGAGSNGGDDGSTNAAGKKRSAVPNAGDVSFAHTCVMALAGICAVAASIAVVWRRKHRDRA